jgi:putative PIN family toxin of toxin-antitoxin system
MDKTIRAIIDSNIWISFAIGKRLNELQIIFEHPKVEVFVCQRLLLEVKETIKKPKLSKYVLPNRRTMLLELMQACRMMYFDEQISVSRDPNDDFLLDLAVASNADFLITGDKDLLILKNYQQTNIVTFNAFMTMLEVMN